MTHWSTFRQVCHVMSADSDRLLSYCVSHFAVLSETAVFSQQL